MFLKKTYTFVEVQDICEKILKILNDYYERDDLLNPYSYDKKDLIDDLTEKSMLAFLSNGDSFSYSIPKKSLAHLLGIDTDYLATTSIFGKNLNSYELLLQFAKNAKKVFDYSSRGIIDITRVISPYVLLKIDSFYENVNLDLNHVDFICKYDKNRSYGYANFSFDMDYMIVQQKNDKYYLLILVKENNGDSCIPISNQVFDSYDELYKSLLTKIPNQEITLLSGLNIRNRKYKPIKFWIRSEDRLNKIKALLDFANDFDCIPNITSDHIRSLEILDSNREDKGQMYLIYEKIGKVMSRKELIDYDKLGIRYESAPQALISVIDSYNSSLFEDADSFDKYSNVQKQNQSLQEKLDNALEKVKQLDAELNEITNKYKDAINDNEILSQKIEDIKKILG